MNSLDFLIWLQGWATPWLDTAMGTITYLGTEYFYIAALSLLYWCVDTRGSMRLMVILLFSTYVGGVVKELTGVLRPFQAHPGQIRGLFTDVAGGYAFPSSHAQDGTVFWGYLSIAFRKRWLYILAPIAVLLIAFSRLYLGVHWPRDVLWGIVFGLIILGGSYVLLRLLAGAPLRVKFPSVLVLAIMPLLLFLFFPSHQGASSMGVIFGAALGYPVERRYIRFATRRPIWQQALKLLIGLTGAFLLLFGLKALLKPLIPVPLQSFPVDDSPPVLGSETFVEHWIEAFTFFRYTMIGLWATLIAPAIFRLLFGREEADDAAV